jgi:type VI secretion system protein ImpL
VKKVLSFLTNRWFLGALTVLIVALIIWFFGPLIAIADNYFLEGVTTRIVTISVIAVTWLVFMLIGEIRRAKASNELAQGVVEQEHPVDADDGSKDDVAQLKGRFDEALTMLKQTRGSKGKLNLYDLPWYVIIGPPGSGKTTALMNSGLHFPLADRFGNEALRGVGGTRNCDWWFTDQAILLDTAGRYTTQDSDASSDMAEWLGFLDLLKKHRKRRPINGVMIALSASDILQLSPLEREQHVTAIRQRIQELYDRTGIRAPIYVLLTKADLLAGFIEFFEDLSSEERAQVWGMTFPVEGTTGNPADLFSPEFDELVERLNERVLERVDRERDPIRRTLIYDFPAQLANVKASVSAFLDDIFRGSTYETNAFVRGVYLTSGTQEGSPIDRLMGAVSRNFGLSMEQLPAFRGQGRSFFVSRLLTDVIFKESELAGTNRRAERMKALGQWGVYAGVGIATVLALVFWFFAYLNNSSYLEDNKQTVALADAQVDLVDQQSDLLLEVLPALDAVKQIPVEVDYTLGVGLGLDQGDKIDERVEDRYRSLLEGQLLPRLMLELESQIRRGGNSPDYLYEALKRYLMLDSQAHYDSEAINSWFKTIWTDEYLRRATNEQLAAMHAHLDELFAVRPEPLPIPLDDALIERARRTLTSTPAEQRAYGRILRSPTQDLRGFDVVDAAGRDAMMVFQRRSGVPLNEPLPPLFTRAGYFEVFLPQTTEIATTMQEESWVLGVNGNSGLNVVEMVADIKDLYFQDFADAYHDLLTDLTLASFSNADQAARILNILSSDNSPLTNLIVAVKEETDLSDSGPLADISGKAGEAAQAQQELASALGRSSGRAGRLLSGMNRVEQRFKPVHDLVPDDGPGALDNLMKMIRDLYLAMDLMATRPGREATAEVQRAAREMRREADREGQPEFIAGLLDSASSNAQDIASGNDRARLNNAWQADALQFCQTAIAGRYPIDRNSLREVQFEDFRTFFGKDGIVDEFFNTYLAEHVDTRTNPWRARPGTQVRLDPAALRQFQRARAIRDAFFRRGGGANVDFTLTPDFMDQALTYFSLNLDGQEVSYSFGPQITEALTWPGQNGPDSVRIVMQPPGSSGTTMIREMGPWSWFRVLDQSRITPINDETFKVVFSLDGRSVHYLLTARSAYNPFNFDELHQFRCPNGV